MSSPGGHLVMQGATHVSGACAATFRAFEGGGGQASPFGRPRCDVSAWRCAEWSWQRNWAWARQRRGVQRNAAVWEDLEWGLDLGAETIGEAGRGHVAVQGNRHPGR